MVEPPLYLSLLHLHLSSCLLGTDSLISCICAMSTRHPFSPANSNNRDNLTWVWPSTLQSLNRWIFMLFTPLQFLQIQQTPVALPCQTWYGEMPFCWDYRLHSLCIISARFWVNIGRNTVPGDFACSFNKSSTLHTYLNDTVYFLAFWAAW